MKDKKKIVIGTLCALIMIMAVGYALLSQQLSINGSAAITSNWQVEITNITEKEKSTGATTNSTNYTATTARFNTSLTSPGDYALYEVTVTNKGTLDAVLAANPAVTTGNNEAITYELEGIKKGDKILKNNQTDTFTIKVQYNPATTTQPSTLTSDIQVTLNYQQDLGQVSPYEYSIGDKITFAGSDWYVIKNSTYDEDYISLMKQRVLTHEELGNRYAIKYTCTEYNVNNHQYDCVEIDQVKSFDTMPYYWDQSCHNNYSINGNTYNSRNESGCSGHNDYARSKVNEFLSGTYLNRIGTNKLKEVDGYKIRLITWDELLGNLGYSMSVTSANAGANPIATENVPTWVYQNFGEGENNIYGYWTMSPNDNAFFVWNVTSRGILGGSNVNQSNVFYDDYGVRPVINLLKSAIE